MWSHIELSLSLCSPLFRARICWAASSISDFVVACGPHRVARSFSIRSIRRIREDTKGLAEKMEDESRALKDPTDERVASGRVIGPRRFIVPLRMKVSCFSSFFSYFFAIRSSPAPLYISASISRPFFFIISRNGSAAINLCPRTRFAVFLFPFSYLLTLNLAEKIPSPWLS